MVCIFLSFFVVLSYCVSLRFVNVLYTNVWIWMMTHKCVNGLRRIPQRLTLLLKRDDGDDDQVRENDLVELAAREYA